MTDSFRCELYLLSDDRVQDVALWPGPPAVAFVVPRGKVAAAELQKTLSARYGANAPFVQLLDAIPVDPTGEIDDLALARIAIPLSARGAEIEQTFGARGREVVALCGPAAREERFTPVDELFDRKARPPIAGVAATFGLQGPAETQRQSSVSIGPLCDPAPSDPRDLVAMLLRGVQSAPGQEIICIAADGARQILTFEGLLKEARSFLGGLNQRGLRAGDKVVFQLPRPSEFLIAFWGCTLGGIIPVPLAPANSQDRNNPQLARLIAISERLKGPLLIADGPTAALYRQLSLNAVAWSDVDRSQLADAQPRTPTDPAILSFTSGSTGTPKGVVLSHENLLALCLAMAVGGWMEPDDVALGWLPLNHVASLSMTHLASIWRSARHILVARDYILADILRWLDLLSEMKGTRSWAPNFAFVLANAELEKGERRQWDLTHVRSLMCGGEPVAAATVNRFCELLGGVGLRRDAVAPGWGMTETSSMFTIVRGVVCDDSGPFVHLGPPGANAQMRVADDHDGVLPEGTIGHLQVRGAGVLKEYFEDPQVNARSFTQDGWFRTGDVAIIRNGSMAIAGREKEILIVNGQNLYPSEIEAVVDQVPGVEPTWSAACPTRSLGAQTDSIIVFFVLAADPPPFQDVLRGIRATVGRSLGLSIDYLVSLEKALFPRTELGKKGRTLLKNSFEAGGFLEERLRCERLVGGPRAFPDLFARPRWTRRDQLPGEGDKSPVVFIGPADQRAAFVAEAEPTACLHWPRAETSQIRRMLDELRSKALGPVTIIVAISGQMNDAAAAVSAVLDCGRALIADAAPARLWVLAAEGGSTQSDRAALLVPGLLWSLTAEHPRLAVRMIWSAASSAESGLHAAREFRGARRSREVLWKAEGRYERHYEGWQPSRASKTSSQNAPALYIITGGLGGIAKLWAQQLRQAEDARLLLIGRRPDSEAAALVKQLGSHALYEHADVRQAPQVVAAIKRAEAHFGLPVSGAFHFAGTAESGAWEDERAESLIERASTHAQGGVALAEALAHRPEAKLVFASSLMGVLGAGQHAAYCAGTGFLERWAATLRQRGRRAVTIALSAVRSTGLARTYRALAPGYRWLEVPQLLAALTLACEIDEPCLLVGVEASAVGWRSADLGSGRLIEGIHLFADSQVPSTEVPLDATMHWLAALPRSSSGAVNRTVLADLIEAGDADPPKDALEELLADAFREVLSADRISRGSDFFALGGGSLHATRIAANVGDLLGFKMSEAAIFEHSTVARLSSYVRELIDVSQIDVTRLSEKQVSDLLNVLSP